MTKSTPIQIYWRLLREVQAANEAIINFDLYRGNTESLSMYKKLWCDDAVKSMAFIGFVTSHAKELVDALSEDI